MGLSKSFLHYSHSYSSFLFIDPTTTEIYTLSLHDALPISARRPACGRSPGRAARPGRGRWAAPGTRTRRSGRPGGSGRPSDRKSTRLNSSHPSISYAVFCLKKKKNLTLYILHIILYVHAVT